MQTLDELKAENAALEAKQLPSPKEGEEEAKYEVVEVKEEEAKEDSDLPKEDALKTETETWMQSDGQTSTDDDGDSSNAAWAGARVHYKAKAKKEKEEHNEEVKQLQTRISNLEQSGSQGLNEPKRESFDNSDDPDSAYTNALMDWKINNSQAQADAKKIQEAYVSETQQAVDHHYERAAKLAKKSKISAEHYHAADLRVRQAIDAVRPGHGDVIAEQLIADLGEGSEKVFYNLGVNNDRLSKFINLLQSNSSGIKAGMYLSQINTDLGISIKRTTQAPAPAQQAQGDAGPIKFGAAKKQYAAAHSSRDYQKAFNIRQAAKKEGADTNDW